MKKIMLTSLLATITFAVTSAGQTLVVASPAEPGMYIEVSGGLTKIIGQIAEFKRSGSLLVSDITVGIKTKKRISNYWDRTRKTSFPRSRFFTLCPPSRKPKRE